MGKNLIIFHQGRAEYFHGGYDYFLDKVGWEGEQTIQKKEKTKINKNSLSNALEQRLVDLNQRLEQHLDADVL